MPEKDDSDEIAMLSRKPMAFFSHDSHAADDEKCKRLINRLGFEGYGRWWLLCELLAATDGHALPVQTDEDMLILSDSLGFKPDALDCDVQIDPDAVKRIINGIIGWVGTLPVDCKTAKMRDLSDALNRSASTAINGSVSELAVNECKRFIEQLIDLRLVRLTDGGEIVSDRMNENAAYFGRNRHNGSKGGRPRKNKTPDERM